ARAQGGGPRRKPHATIVTVVHQSWSGLFRCRAGYGVADGGATDAGPAPGYRHAAPGTASPADGWLDHPVDHRCGVLDVPEGIAGTSARLGNDRLDGAVAAQLRADRTRHL